MNVLADMGVSQRTVQWLAAFGHNVAHVRDQGMRTAQDYEIIGKARREGRVVITFDLDFGDIMAASGDNLPSVIILRPHGILLRQAFREETNSMEAIKILEKKENLNWDYDEEADVLYISMGEPQKAVGVDIGDGAIVRYVEATNEVVGLTLIGMKERLLNSLKKH
jgi:predicted nuclease of predicted toxin-antitoxin system